MSCNKRLTATLLTTALFSFSGQSTAKAPDIEHLAQPIDGHQLTLNNETEKCELIVANNDDESPLALPLTPPCYWVTKPASTQAQHYAYPDNNISHVLLIAGTTLNWDEEKKAYHKLPLDTYCSQYFQGVVIKDGLVALAGKQMEAPNCVGQTVAEKVFHGVSLAQETNKEMGKKGLFDSIKETFEQLFQPNEQSVKTN